jgi:outer membrane receptor protein involved in Fe transport
MAHFDIPAQPLADSLRAVGNQTHTNILFDPPLVAGRNAPALKADLSAVEAISRLLEGQGIRYEVVDDSTVVLAAPASADSTNSSAADSSTAKPQAQEGKPSASEGFRVAQVDHGTTASTAAVGAESPQTVNAPPSGQDIGSQVSEVVVTGSRVIRAGMSSPTPVTSMSTAELAAANPQSLAQGLAELPSLATSTTPQSIGGRTTLGPGSFLNLRGLGPTRNLVLLDGRRVAPTNIAGDVDINLLPQSLVSNVSIVTGGASAAYGSDAVAGVTNFILDTHFTGFKGDVSAGTSDHGDGDSYKLSLAWGDRFLGDHLHVIASFDWRHSQPAYSANRDWANNHCAVIPIPGVTPATESITHPRQTLACNVTQPNSAYGGAITTGPLVTPTQGISFGPGGVPQNFNYGAYKSATDQVGGTGNPNYLGDVVNLVTPMDNKVAFGHLTYDVSDSLTAFAQVTASRTESHYLQTPAYFNGNTAFTLYSGNPFIPASIQARMTQLNVPSFQLGITPKSWGVIGAAPSEEAYDAVTGLKGKFGGNWDWDIHYEHGRTQFREEYPNQISLANVYRAADAVVGPNGAVTCYSALLDPAKYGNCVPLNVFGPGSPSAAALAYIHGTPVEWNVMTQDDAAVSINGEPVSLWAGPVSVGVGGEWRKLQGVQTSDPTSHSPIDFTDVRGVPGSWLNQVGGWATTNVLPFRGAYHVSEGYAELLVPLAKDLPLLKSLELNTAGRVTDYSQSGTVETWKIGLTWRPIDDLLLRATRSRDIRAPGIGDLYSPNSLSPNVVVTDRLNGNASVSVPTALAGNSTLVPEKANTFTGGFTWQPSWLSGFAVSADYYDIKIAEVLASVTAQETIDRCALGEQQFCDQLLRNSNGTLYLIRLPTLNLSQARTRGLDLDTSYRFEVGHGNLGFRIIGTRLFEQSTTVPRPTGAAYSDRAGDISLGYPKWLLNGTITYDQGPIGLDLVARFVSSGLYNTTYVPGDLDSRFTTIASNLTFNLGARYRLRSFPGEPELYFNIQNLFDKDPPLVPGNSLIGFQTNSTLYDTMGRYFSGGVRVAF